MNIIIPMAGMGKRMRPHTLTTPKPLLPIAGKPIVQRLVEDIAATSNQKIDNIAFIVGRFGTETEEQLLNIAKSLGAQGHICYQDEPLGTAHAILCAEKLLNGPVFVAFADTLFDAEFNIDNEKEAIVWVQKISNPEAFGVTVLNNEGKIIQFVEKPKTFVSDLAIIGIYYFKNGENLKNELNYLLDNKISQNGEYYLTTAMENMLQKELAFYTSEVKEWLDCGNKDATVFTNGRILDLKHKKENLIDPNTVLTNSVIIEPCFIGKGVTLINSIVGPGVSIEQNCTLTNTNITNSIVQEGTQIENANIDNSMIGKFASYKQLKQQVSLGDYSTHN